MRYTADRAANEAVQVHNEMGTAVPISLDRDLVFSADVCSQNEIEEIALNPAAHLELFDRFKEADSARFKRDLDQLGRELAQSTADLMRLDSEIDDLIGKSSAVVVFEESSRDLLTTRGRTPKGLMRSRRTRDPRQ